jgi:hypothetical protein
MRLGVVACAFKASYLRGRDRRVTVLGYPWEKYISRLYLKAPVIPVTQEAELVGLKF